VPVVQGISIYAMLLSIVHNTSSVYWAEGRPQILTWIGLTRLAVLFPVLYWASTSAASIVTVAWAQAAIALFSVLLNFTVASRLIGLSPADIWRALNPAIFSSAIMAGAVLLFLNTVSGLAPWLTLLLSVIVGGASYLAALWFLQRDVIEAAAGKLLSALGRA
jgi:hypothetical protein